MVRALFRARGVRLFHAEFKLHHEIHPPLAIGTDCAHHGGHRVLGQAVAAEDLGDLGGLGFRDLLGFAFFPGPFSGKVFRIGSRGQVAAQAHRNRTGRDFGESGGDDQGSRIHAHPTVRQRERTGPSSRRTCR